MNETTNIKKVLMITLAILVVAVVPAVFAQADTPSLPFGIAASQTVFLGIVLGITTRLVYPYLGKVRAAASQNQPIKFDWNYLVVSVVNLVQSAIIATLLFGTGEIPALSGFFGGFTYGYASQDIAHYFL